MATNPGREQGLQRTIDIGNERLLTELVKQLPSTCYLMANPTETDTAVTGEVPMKAQLQTTTQV